MPTPGGPMNRTFVASSRNLQRAELVDERPVDRGLGVEVEVGQAPRRRQRGEPFQARTTPGFGRGDLDREQALEHRGVAEALDLGRLEHPRQRLGRGRQAERREMAAQRLIDGGLGHRAVSTSSA